MRPKTARRPRFASALVFAVLVLLATGALRADEAGDAKPAKETTAGKVVDSPEKAVPLGVGAKAPDVELLTTTGEKVALREVLAKKPTVLIFYRGGWCPFCMRHLANVAALKDELVADGLQVVAISPDVPSFARDDATKRELDYTLLCDPKAAAIRGFGLAFRLDDGTYERYKRFVDLEIRAGGETHHVLPVPAAYVISEEGEVLFAHSDPDYKKRVDAKELRAAAKKALAGE